MNGLNTNIRRIENQLKKLAADYNMYEDVDGVSITFEQLKIIDSSTDVTAPSKNTFLLFQRAEEEKDFIIEEMKRVLFYFEHGIESVNSVVNSCITDAQISFLFAYRFRISNKLENMKRTFDFYLTPISASSTFSFQPDIILSDEEGIVC